jgi:hypothetical protein
MSVPDPVLCLLIYVLIGSFFWLVCVHVGAIEAAFASKGHQVSLLWASGATVCAIMAWPLFAWITWKRRREVWVRVRRAVWR